MLRKYIPYLVLNDELWGVFSDMLGENTLWDIKSALYYSGFLYAES